MPTLSYQSPSTDKREQTKVLQFTQAARSVGAIYPEIVFQEKKSFEVTLTRAELPLTVQYDDKTYILVLTKSNKLLLQKPLS
jgi:hypothetical protein